MERTKQPLPQVPRLRVLCFKVKGMPDVWQKLNPLCVCVCVWVCVCVYVFHLGLRMGRAENKNCTPM